MSRPLAVGTAAALLGVLLLASALAPDYLPTPNLTSAYLSPFAEPPFGTDQRGRPLVAYVLQGARIVIVPALAGGVLVALLAAMGGLVRCGGNRVLDTSLHGAGEILGALPRMVVVLVVGMLLPATERSLFPLAMVWAVLCAPNAIDEAGAVASRLGGARFVEALHAHGYSWARIYGLHVVAYNLRPVVVRQGAEAMLQILFLEMALSYLAGASDQPGLTHPDRLHSWADLLQMGYPSLVLDVPTGHALALGIGICGVAVVFSRAVTSAAAAR